MPEYPLRSEAGLLLVHARLSGPKGSCVVRLALDTGATTTIIPPKAALAIGCHPGRATQFRETLTASGKELIPMLVVPKLLLFEKVFRRVTVACHGLPAESPVDGLLGLDLLVRLKVAIDLKTLTIRIP